MRGGRIREFLASNLWFVPALGVLGAIALSVGSVAVDRALAGERTGTVIFPAGVETARSLLSTIASSMITFTGLVFTITMVVLQLSSNRFSPRVLRQFLRDRVSQVSLATFVATFTFAIMVLRALGTRGDGSPFVPRISTSLAFVLVLVSVGVFVHYVDHVARAIRVSHITASVGKETADAIESLYPSDRPDDEGEQWSPDREPDRVIAAESAGVVALVDDHSLVSIARRAGAVLELRAAPGDFVPRGSALVAVHGDGELNEKRVRAQVHLGEERTMQQDVAFGFRQLVDVAERALSPGTIDPTTAAQAVDQLHDLLRDLAGRPLPSRRVLRDEDGDVRVVIPDRAWQDYLDLAVDEVALYGASSIQIRERLQAMLSDLLSVTSGDRRRTVEGKLRSLRQGEVPKPSAVARASA